MSSIAALNTAIGDLTTEVTAVQTAITDLVAEVTNLNTAVGSGDAAAIQTATSAVNAATNALTAAAKADPGPQLTPPPPPPVGTQAFDPGTNLPLYSQSVPGSVASPPWTAVTDVTGTGGTTLYTFAGDTAGQPPTGATSTWAPYTGTLVVVTPPRTQAFDPATNLALYTYVGPGANPPSTPPWTLVTDVTTGEADPQALYTFAGDTPGQPPTGTTAATWEPWTGPLTVTGQA